MSTSTLRAAATGVLAIAVISTACATIMGVEEPKRRRDSATVDEGGVVTPSPTATNPGPPSDGSSGGTTDPPTQPPCVGAGCPCTKTPTDSCPTLTYCQETEGDGALLCAPGCKDDKECADFSKLVPHCNARHECVECTDNVHCTDAVQNTCAPSGQCTSKCVAGGAACPSGQECCGDVCVDTKVDPLNCGQCKNACPGVGGKCCAGQCRATATDLANCGDCGKTCTGVKNTNSVECRSGACGYVSCSAGFGDCDNVKTNGCECTCPPECTSCGAGGACTIDCTKKNCGNSILCPAQLDCIILCRGFSNCTGVINCPANQRRCIVDCEGPYETCAALVIQAQNAQGCLACRGASGTCHNVECNDSNGCGRVCGPGACNTVCEPPSATCNNVGACQ